MRFLDEQQGHYLLIVKADPPGLHQQLRPSPVVRRRVSSTLPNFPGQGVSAASPAEVMEGGPLRLAGRPLLAHPAITLHRWCQAWTDKDPPSELQALIDAVTTGHGLDLYCRIQRTTSKGVLLRFRELRLRDIARTREALQARPGETSR